MIIGLFFLYLLEPTNHSSKFLNGIKGDTSDIGLSFVSPLIICCRPNLRVIFENILGLENYYWELQSAYYKLDIMHKVKILDWEL